MSNSSSFFFKYTTSITNEKIRDIEENTINIIGNKRLFPNFTLFETTKYFLISSTFKIQSQN